MRLAFLACVVLSFAVSSDIYPMKRKRRGSCIRKKRKKIKKRELSPEEIEEKKTYYCTSLVQLASCEILKNYRTLLQKNWYGNLNFEVQEHLIHAMACKGILLSKNSNKCSQFSTLIRKYKMRNPDYRKDISLVEQYIDKLCIVNAIKEGIRRKKYARSGPFNYLKDYLKDTSNIRRLCDKNVQVILGSFVYLFSPKCKRLLYADGHENEEVSCSKYVAIGNKKRLFVGYSDGCVLFVSVGGAVLSGNVNGLVTDIILHQENEEIVRAGILYETNSEQKVRFVRAFENKESQWFLDSNLHILAAEDTIESMEFEEDQLVTQTSKAKQIWDFVPDREGDLHIKNTHTIFMN